MANVIRRVFHGHTGDFRGLRLAMTAKEILSVEGKRGKVEGDAMALQLGAGEDLVVSFDGTKAQEIRYTLALSDLTAAAAAWKAVIAELTSQHGTPTEVSTKGTHERQTWKAGKGARIYANHYIQRGADELGEPDSGVVQVVVDPDPDA
jgi:hypothetical protein